MYLNLTNQLLGYKYIIESIKECIYNNGLITPFETNLYKIISKKFDLNSPLYVKWRIDKTINTMNKYTDENILYNYFHLNRISSKTFISEVFLKVSSKIRTN